MHILDFYHAKEKLVIFARHQFDEDHQRKRWIDHQCHRLMNNEVEEVMNQTRSCRARSKEAKVAKNKLLEYYTEHDDRMQYQTYRDAGLLIGSGPV